MSGDLVLKLFNILSTLSICRLSTDDLKRWEIKPKSTMTSAIIWLSYGVSRNVSKMLVTDSWSIGRNHVGTRNCMGAEWKRKIEMKWNYMQHDDNHKVFFD